MDRTSDVTRDQELVSEPGGGDGDVDDLEGDDHCTRRYIAPAGVGLIPSTSSLMTFLSRARQVAEATPTSRNRVVDLVRVLSILVVVFGHWLMAAITFEEGEIVPGHLLELASWTHPLTWVFQVMPLFFFVGGYSNALSWRSARGRGDPYGAWLRARLLRLALSVVPLLLVWTIGGWVGLRLGLDWEILQLASRVALVPTWFLAAYVVIVTLAPPLLALWERAG